MVKAQACVKFTATCRGTFLCLFSVLCTSVHSFIHKHNDLLTAHHSTLDQWSETNVMHILFSSLRIKSLYMFRALLSHPQEALHKQHLVYCVRVMSVGCTRIGLELVSPFHSNPGYKNAPELFRYADSSYLVKINLNMTVSFLKSSSS
jgi:hypothetical protein